MSFKRFSLVTGFLIFMASMMVAINGFAVDSGPAPITSANWNGFVPSTNGVVYAITYDGDGSMYIGGEFTQAGGIPANNIAKWKISTATWSPVIDDVTGANGVDGAVKALAYDSSKQILYVGGFFTNAGGITANCIAKWKTDTELWSALGTGMPGDFDIVNALVLDGTNLYAGGFFNTAGGTPANNIAKWDGLTTWSSLRNGTNDEVNALAYNGNDSILYAGGWFTAAGNVGPGDVPANYVAQCDVSGAGVWSTIGVGTAGMNGPVNALCYYSCYFYDFLAAGGQFTTADGKPANNIAQHDLGSGEWYSLGTGVNNSVNAIYADSNNDVIYAGGQFTSAGGASAARVAGYDLWENKWSPLASGTSDTVRTLACDSENGILYLGGNFATAGGKASKFLAKCAFDSSITVPGAPINAKAYPKDGSADILFDIPMSFLPISSYAVTSSPGGDIVYGDWGLTFDELTNGVAYTFTVKAINALGVGPASAPSKAVTPSTTPDAPTSVTATVNGVDATITFTAPKFNGGRPITQYTVYSSKGDYVVLLSGTASPIKVANLSSNTPYTFTVTASNANGESLPSDPSNQITTATVPDAPTAVTATPGMRQATVSFTAPVFNGGSPITSYTVYASDGFNYNTGTKSPITVTGLSSDRDYTFIVTASNAFGESIASVPSDSVRTKVVNPPGAPTAVKATAGILQATVSFIAPTVNGGVPITSYNVYAYNSHGVSVANVEGVKSPITVPGLTGGETYTFTVVATNYEGLPGPESSPSNPITLATILEPGAPTAVKAVAGVLQATVSFTAPKVNGGAPITEYTVTTNHMGGIAVTGKTSPIIVTGLNYNEYYKFQVMATNAMGNSPGSELSATSVKINGAVPGAPSNVAAIRGDGQAIVNFNLPLYTGGTPIIEYNVISGGKILATQATRPITVTGLQNGKPYIFTVAARNDVGTGPSSLPSITVTPATVPDAPTAVKATPGNTQATVAFTAPVFNGGSPITSYTVTSNDGKFKTGAASPLIVSGLTNGTGYTFTVKATNVAGSGAPSDGTAVTPAAVMASAIPDAITPVIDAAPAGIIDDTIEHGDLAITWTPTPVGGKFAGGTAYTATFTLVPYAAYTLAGIPANFFKVAGATTTNAAGSGVVKAVFPKTAATITLSAIPGVTPPVVGAIPKTTTATAQYTGTVVWDPADAKFAPGVTYTAAITLTPKAGYSLSGVAEDFFKVSGATATNAAGSGLVNAQFEATPLLKISTAAITGVAVPVVGASGTSANSTTEYTAMTEWSGSPFAPATGYSARITLSPEPGYTLVGVPANFFKIAGATTQNDAGSGVVLAIFPSTATTVASGEIPGVTVPVTGAAPKLTLTATTYTGTIAWDPVPAGGKFAPNTAYTATITLVPKTGYTLVGIGLGYFTVAGTSEAATNDGGVVTAKFQATEKAPITAIAAIIGTGKAGSALTAGSLTPSGADATATYQWKISDTASGTYADIGLATDKTYTPWGEAVGKYIKVEATAHGDYSGSCLSAAKLITAVAPNQPNIFNLTPGQGEVTIIIGASWDGGSPVTQWTATASPGGKTGTSATPTITVTGLTNGVTYTFTVKAKNAVGTSPASAASDPVTPPGT